MSAHSSAKLAPVLAATMLLGLLVWNSLETSTAGGVDLYMARSKEQINAVPWRIGRFFGAEMPIPQLPSVIKLLKPNEILQRRYTDVETGESFSLLIVHCGRADDMFGHFPPNCYPNAGWVPEAPPAEVVVHAGEREIPARHYRYRHEGSVPPQRTDILAFFVVPAGQSRYGGDMDLVDRSSRSPASDKLGAAQIQILTSGDMSDETRREIWDQALDALAPALYTIAEGV